MRATLLSLLILLLFQSSAFAQTPVPLSSSSRPNSLNACCGAWFETEAPGRHEIVDVRYSKGSYIILSNDDGYGAVAKYSEFGELTWRFKMEVESQFSEIDELGNGSLVIGGQVGVGNRQGLLLIISSDGVVVKQETITHSGYSKLSVQDVTADSKTSTSAYTYVVSSYGYISGGSNTPEQLFKSRFFDSSRSTLQEGTEYVLQNPYLMTDETGSGNCQLKVYEVMDLKSSTSAEQYLLSGKMCNFDEYGFVIAANSDGTISRAWVPLHGDDMLRLSSTNSNLVVASGRHGVNMNNVQSSYRKSAIHILDTEGEEKYRTYTFNNEQINRDFFSIETSSHLNGYQKIYASSYMANGRPVIVEATVNPIDNSLDFSANGLFIGPPGENTEGVHLGINPQGDTLLYAYSFSTEAGLYAPYNIRFGRIPLPLSPSSCLSQFPLTVVDEGQKNMVKVQQFSHPSSSGWTISDEGQQSLIAEALIANGPCQLDDLTPCATPSALATSGYFKLPREVASCTDKVVKVQIDDALGRTVTNWTMNLLSDDVVIDITTLPPGRYYLTLAASDDSVIYTTRVSTF